MRFRNPESLMLKHATAAFAVTCKMACTPVTYVVHIRYMHLHQPNKAAGNETHTRLPMCRMQRQGALGGLTK